MTPRRTSRIALAAALTFAPILGGCGSSGGSGGAPAPSTKPLGAAEPAVSPKPAVTPAGRVDAVGTEPEGLAYDPKTDVLALATRVPNQLTLLQGATGEVLRRIALPGHARHLQLAEPGGPILVPAENANRFLQVSLPDGQVTSTEVGRYPHNAVRARSGEIVVADERGGQLSVLDGTKVVHTFDDPTQPGGLAAVEGGVAEVDVATFTLSRYDLRKQDRTARVSAGTGPTHLVAISGDRLAVVDTRGNAIRIFSSDSLEQVTSLGLAGTPYGVAYDDAHDRVWVTLTATNQVVELDASGPAVREVARFPTVRQPNTVAVDPSSGRVWVASRTTGTLQTIDGSAGRPDRP